MLTRRTALKAAAGAAALALDGHRSLPAQQAARQAPPGREGYFGRGPAGPLAFRQFGADAAGPHVLVVVDSRDRALEEAFTPEALERHGAWFAALRAGWKLTLVPAIYEPGNPLRERAEWRPGFPPEEGYYDHAEDPGSRYLWRWIGMQAPDVVIVARAAARSGVWLGGLGELPTMFEEKPTAELLPSVEADSLAAALTRHPAAGVGTIPAAEIRGPGLEAAALTKLVLGMLLTDATIEPSPARRELARRRTRSPRAIAEELAAVYGQKLDPVAYIPALPLVAKLRLSDLTGDKSHHEQVERIVEPFRRGERSPVPKSGSEQAGHLIFAELAARSQGEARRRWIELCRAAADQAFATSGEPLPIAPFHNEMSDAVFMAGPILAATGRLTGERRYFDAAAIHFASMRKLCLREDGLYRHSPLCEAAWGRGNGFPALGLAWALSEWPDDHPAQAALVVELQKHLAALKKHQDLGSGCWHQIIDQPDSYREYTATCMIGWAMQRGIRRGWLAAGDFQPCVERAWTAIKERTGPDGKLVDVCTGTGKQPTLDNYYRRPAILGRDDRGGAMGMMLATEMMG